MKILPERKPVKIVVGVLIGFVLLFVGIIIVQQVQEQSDLKRAEAYADSAELTARLQDNVIESEARVIELEIGPIAANCFRAIGGKWDAAEMVKHCGMTAEQAKLESVRYPKILAKSEADEARRQQSELSKLGKIK